MHGALAAVPPQNHDADSGTTSAAKLSLISIHFAGGLINAVNAGQHLPVSPIFNSVPQKSDQNKYSSSYLKFWESVDANRQ